jgi:phage shock protein A
MFARISRIIKAFLNKFITLAEDPITILENNIREMRDKIPQLNAGIAKAHGNVILLEKKLAELKSNEADLRAKLKAAALSNQDEIGKDIALELQKVIDQVKSTEISMIQANEGLKNMEELRDTQMRKIRKETEKIKTAIENAKISKLKAELAELFETYNVGDVAYSNEEMLEKLNKESAINEGKLKSASKSVDMTNIRLEQRAEEIQAEELYKQFKAEMNLDVVASGDDDKSSTKQKERQVS